MKSTKQPELAQVVEHPRGTSSSGRASDSHSEGTGIDTRVLHVIPC